MGSFKQRKRNRLKEYDYSIPGWYFVTMCVQNHKCWFGQVKNDLMVVNNYGNIIAKVWQQIPNYNKNILLDEWVIMPNHFHGIVILQQYSNKSQRALSLSEVMRRFKSFTSREINRVCLNSKFQWQRSFYEHVIRNEKSLYGIRQYIVNNPLKWTVDRYYC